MCRLGILLVLVPDQHIHEGGTEVKSRVCTGELAWCTNCL